MLLRADASAVEPHDVEAFGPVSTVIGYDTVDEAITLAARGKGSLAGSLVTHDPALAELPAQEVGLAIPLTPLVDVGSAASSPLAETKT